MPDTGFRDDPRAKRRVCIIGAGVSGLVAAKVFAAAGREIVVVEASAELGGVWAPSKSYPGVRTQTPRDLYCFSDFPMPADYPEWPSGAQVYAYLCNYAAHFDVLKLIRFNTKVLEASRIDAPTGWRVRLADEQGETTEMFDEVVVCTGQFSRPKTLELPGAETFGGSIVHSSAFVDDSVAAGKDVVVLGYSKSATDVAMQALAASAKSVTMVYREPAWKIPYFFGNLVNFKNILYCRASEVMFMPWAPSTVGKIGRALSAPAIWANWRALESLLELQFKLKKKGLRPKGRIEDSIHCATSIETPGFYKAIADGKIRMVQGTLASCTPGHVVTDGGESFAADIAVLAIGWTQELPFLDAPSRAALIEPDGQYRLYRMIVNPDLPGFGLVGFNSSFITTLSAELAAHWLVRWFDGALQNMPSAAEMRADIEKLLAWKRTGRPVAAGFGGLCIAPYHHEHFDELMRDMGARTRPKNPIVANLLPINPKIYATLLATATGRASTVKEHAA
jgi:cation diffusion facilitator CzcD-associated flavoprotein CzcO